MRMFHCAAYFVYPFILSEHPLRRKKAPSSCDCVVSEIRKAYSHVFSLAGVITKDAVEIDKLREGA
jgi:hypothetical protein